MSRPFLVSKYAPAGRKSSWKVEGRAPDGAKVRRFFQTKIEAESFATDTNSEVKTTGWQTMGLADDQRVEAAKCFEKLSATGHSLTEAVDFYLAHLAQTERSVTVNAAVTELLDRKAVMGGSRRYIIEMKHQLERVKESFGERKVSTLTTRELDEWLIARKLSPISHANARRYLSILFNHCIKQGAAKDNPAQRMDIPKAKVKPPGILTTKDMRALIKLTREHHPDLLASVVIQGFAGLRREETQRLDWKHVRLDRGHIEVSAENSKTAQRRLVAIRPNLAAFLAPLRQESGAVSPSCYDECAAELRRHMKKEKHKWPANALRHSFASYHLADCQDAAKTALQMGHKGTGMLFEHYRELVTPDDAAAWFAILPSDGTSGNVISLSTHTKPPAADKHPRHTADAGG